MKKAFAAALALALVVGLSIATAKGVFRSARSDPGDATSSDPKSTPAGDPFAGSAPGSGMTAIDEAAKAQKYLFALFWKSDDTQTAAMKQVFEEAMGKVADRARKVVVSINDPAERDIVKKFDLERAPMPLVLALAPNGAITGGFPTRFEEKDLLGAFASPTTERCMKALQEGKLVFLAVQNAATKSNAEALEGIKQFKADPRYGHATEILTLDPASSAEASFLKDLKIDPNTKVATTAFLAPPGSVIAEFQGPTRKDDLIAALQKASTGCGPGGCGPGGCAPK